MQIDRKGALAAPTQRVCVGPIALHIDSFAKFLADEGYARPTIKSKCLLVADLSRWLKRRRLPLAQLDDGKLKQFYARHRHSIRRGDVCTGQQLLKWLRSLGVIAALPQAVDRTDLGQLTRDYESFLSSQRGLAPATLGSYLPIVRKFLTERFSNSALRVEDLRPRDLHRFILRQVPRGSRNYAKLMVTALRSFLGFLFQRGAIQTDLLAAMPGVANWRLSHLPKSLPPEQVERLLQCCDRS
ncbi:MAG: site-specific integrase, partial [Gammaproteobacteria bacterium]